MIQIHPTLILTLVLLFNYKLREDRACQEYLFFIIQKKKTEFKLLVSVENADRFSVEHESKIRKKIF